MRTEMVELTNLCMIKDGDKYLLQNRVKKDWQGYTFPGGHVEPGESIVQSVIREVKEETGLTLKNPHLVGVKQFWVESGRYIVFLFSATKFTGELRSSHEGELRSSHEGEVGWFTKEEMKKINLVNHFFEHLDVFEGDYSEYIYESEDFIKIY